MKHRCNWSGPSWSGWRLAPSSTGRSVNTRVMLFFLNCHEPLGQIARDDGSASVRSEAFRPCLMRRPMYLPPTTFRDTSMRASTWSRSPAESASWTAIDRAAARRCRPDRRGHKAISPHEGIGRGMKVGKEEIIGLLTAVERYLTLDHEAEFRQWERRAADLLARLATIPGIDFRADVPAIANHAPHVIVEWDARHS